MKTTTDYIAAVILLGTFWYLLFYSFVSYGTLDIQIDASRINKEEKNISKPISEPVKIENIEIKVSRTNASGLVSQSNDERVNLLRKGCNLDQR